MFGNVLVGVDGRSGGRDAIALAKRLARPHARIVLATAYGDGGPFGSGAGVPLATEGQEAAQLLADERLAAGIEAETVACPARAPAQALHRLADENGSDLLVLGSSRRGRVGRVLLGDDTLASLQGAPCAVAIAPHGYVGTAHGLRRIAVGADSSAEGELALELARRLARRTEAVVTAICVVPLGTLPTEVAVPADWTTETEAVMEAEHARLDAIEGVESRVLYGRPSHELARHASEFDLMIVGSRGYGPVGRLLAGSVSRYLARHAQCPILVLTRPFIPSAAAGPGGPSPDPHEPLAPTS